MTTDPTPYRLIEDEERYRSLLEATFEAIALYGDGHLLDANHIFEVLFGYPLAEALGTSLLELIVPACHDLVTPLLNQPASRCSAEAVGVRKDGSVFNIELVSKPHIYRGRPVQVIALRDTTERSQAEDELQKAKEEMEEQHQRLEALYNIGQIINSTLEPDIILDRLTDEAMRITRATHGQVLEVRKDTHCFERRSLRGFAPEQAMLARAIPLSLDQGINGRAYRTQTIVRVDDVLSEENYFALIPQTRTELAVPIIRNGRVLGNLDLQSPEVGAFYDVDLNYLKALADQVATALTNAQLFHTVEKSKRDWELTFNAMQDAVALVNYDCRVMQANHAFLSLTPDKLRVVGQRYDEIFSSAHCPLAHCPLAHAITSEDPASCTHEFRDRIFDIQTIPLSASEEADEEARLIYVMRDMTEQRRAEEQLRISAAKLEQSNRELQDFASVASHDLQEPLRKIQAFGDRLKAKCGDTMSPEGQDYLERMQSAAGRMQSLINDLLTYSRVTTKAQPFTPVDLNIIAQEVLIDLEIRVEDTEGRVDVSELLTLEADPTQMRQLFQNLIGNALKYHRKEVPPVVKVYGKLIKGLKQRADGEGIIGGYYQLIVEDNGIGFEEKYLDRIFTPFQRLHGRNEFEGTGMGLAVCRKIAERHGGNITARSTPGQGSMFAVTLPVTHPKAEEGSATHS
ncbi:MAG: PAS domain S-box protein [Ardenticatenales bacterium]|nr:PAS domain S-box protein [Ardenticatenales bacterium]